jgi:hypothetical protein
MGMLEDPSIDEAAGCGMLCRMSRTLRVMVIIVLSGCIGRSAEDVSQEFNAFVAERQACSATTECKLVGFGCPLGCGVYINARFEPEVAAKAKELIADYERGGTSCDYDCVQSPPPACTNGRCVAGK